MRGRAVRRAHCHTLCHRDAARPHVGDAGRDGERFQRGNGKFAAGQLRHPVRHCYRNQNALVICAIGVAAIGHIFPFLQGAVILAENIILAVYFSKALHIAAVRTHIVKAVLRPAHGHAVVNGVHGHRARRACLARFGGDGNLALFHGRNGAGFIHRGHSGVGRFPRHGFFGGVLWQHIGLQQACLALHQRQLGFIQRHFRHGHIVGVHNINLVQLRIHGRRGVHGGVDGEPGISGKRLASDARDAFRNGDLLQRFALERARFNGGDRFRQHQGFDARVFECLGLDGFQALLQGNGFQVFQAFKCIAVHLFQRGGQRNLLQRGKVGKGIAIHIFHTFRHRNGADPLLVFLLLCGIFRLCRGLRGIFLLRLRLTERALQPGNRMPVNGLGRHDLLFTSGVLCQRGVAVFIQFIFIGKVRIVHFFCALGKPCARRGRTVARGKAGRQHGSRQRKRKP